jgi:hypothetical protein
MEMVVHKWLQCKNPISTFIECLNSLQSGANESFFSEIMLKNNFIIIYLKFLLFESVYMFIKIYLTAV